MVAFAMTTRVGAEELVERLERLRHTGPTAMAFDADGTLWSGDVGEDVFELACEHGLLRETARPELTRVAAAHGLRADGTPSEIARGIYAAYRRGQVDERLTCEVMTWSYAGFSPDEVRTLARRAFDERGLRARVRDELNPVRDWARREGIRVIVVSASPEVVVREALSVAGIDVFGLSGAVPEIFGDVIAPKMARPVPFGADKKTAGLSLLAGYDWLASFGDNSFDVDLLRAARVGVAVFPKPALLARLGEIDGVFVLS
jgi:phosphoserine phosphatase